MFSKISIKIQINKAFLKIIKGSNRSTNNIKEQLKLNNKNQISLWLKSDLPIQALLNK